MRAVIQRVKHASVSIGGTTKSAIGPGFLILLGIENADTQEDADWLCRKISGLRVFDDAEGVMNRSITDAGGEALVVSQFTLMASYKKGNRPSYIRAAGHANIFVYFCFCYREVGSQYAPMPGSRTTCSAAVWHTTAS